MCMCICIMYVCMYVRACVRFVYVCVRACIYNFWILEIKLENKLFKVHVFLLFKYFSLSQSLQKIVYGRQDFVGILD